MPSLISCLCITHNKPDLLKRAINCFNNQSYVNKQMVIVYVESDLPTHEYVTQQDFGDNIKIVKIGTIPEFTLGELRNISVEEADGSYVCIWDDDDWYDADRLTEQMNHLMLHGKSGSILSLWIIFDGSTQKAYLPLPYPLEGSVLCKRELMLQNPYPPLPKNEDSSVIQRLCKQGELSIIEDMPHLYVYIFHGNNTWDYYHFKKIIVNSLELHDDYTKEVIEAINTIEN